jgi:hypothetical protein
MNRLRRRGLCANLTWLMVGASVGVAVPSLALASIVEERAGGESLEPSRERRAGQKGTLELAAKKKKKKKRAAGGAAPAADDVDKSGSDDAAPSAGASDEEVQKAARVAPTESSSDSSEASAARAKRPTVAIESEGGKASAAEGPAQRFLDVAIGGTAFTRGLTYNQLVQGNLREYQPRLLGGATAAILYYPGAQFSSGFVTNLGLDINVTQAFGVSSRTPDGVSYPTQVHDYNGGVRVRFPLQGLEPSLTIGYGDQAYAFSGAARANLLLPDVHYHYVRAVAGLHVSLPSNLSLFVSAGYRQVLSPGEIKDTYFKNLTVAGAEADAYVAYGINSTIEARVGVDFRRYFYSMHAKNGDSYIAGGAVDQTIAGSLSLAVLLGGPDQPRGSRSHSDDAPASSGDGDADIKATPKKARRPKADGDSTGME